MKKFVFGILIGILLTTTIAVSATILYQANEIGFTPEDNNWNVNNLESALNDLYANKGTPITKFCTFVTSEYGDSSNHLSVGSKYSCDPGDGTPRNFYILEVRGDKVDLIMEENISTETMIWYNAVDYFEETSNGKAVKASWTNVQDVDLPSASAVAKAVGKENWTAKGDVAWFCLESGVKDQPSGPKYCLTSQETETLNTLWLWDYTNGCTDWGCKHSQNSGGLSYWTKDFRSDSYAWRVRKHGILTYDPVSSNDSSIRPVITVLKGNLQG